jgi:Protein of unknown function (DUF2924)
MPTVAIPAPALARRIAGLPQLPIVELRALWQATFACAPLIANRRFLERRIAYHWQASAYEAQHPGVLARQRQRIVELGAALDAARDPAHEPRYPALAPGTVLVRGFNGCEHQVRVLGATDFEYQGQRYRSLSAVARVITGSRWSGPAFFGLRPRRGGKPG